MYKQMTKMDWLTKVQENASLLRKFIGSWHPSTRTAADPSSFEITAPNPEMACQVIREQIQKEEPTDPVDRFDKALANCDIGEIMSLLNGAWFGVPESTSCWSIPGFSIACDLMDDPPENEEADRTAQAGKGKGRRG